VLCCVVLCCCVATVEARGENSCQTVGWLLINCKSLVPATDQPIEYRWLMIQTVARLSTEEEKRREEKRWVEWLNRSDCEFRFPIHEHTNHAFRLPTLHRRCKL
jgi:hypothetical protein